jgi:DNA-binding transcriptional LysR family regulator
MNWDDLKIFLALARHGRINAAATAINVDPTTLSRRLARLQASLDLRLFDQDATGYQLTRHGRRLLADAQGAEASILALQEKAPRADPMSGTIRVAADEGFGVWIVARKLAEFQAAHPQIDVDLIITGDSLDPTSGDVDVAICFERPVAGKLLVRKLTDFTLRLYASQAYVEARPAITSTADLRGHPFIGYARDGTEMPEFDFFAEIGPDFIPSRKSASINAQYAMTAAGLGIGILPTFIADRDRRLMPILADRVTLRRQYWTAMREELRGVPRYRAFNNWLRRVVERNMPLLSGRLTNLLTDDETPDSLWRSIDTCTMPQQFLQLN